MIRSVTRPAHFVRLAFGHQARVGKDTCAEYLQLKYGGKIIHFADTLKRIAEYTQFSLGIEPHKDPKLLQFLGTGLRDVLGQDIWVKCVEQQIRENPEENIFIPDLRFPNEAEMLKQRGFILVKIICHGRLIDRDPKHISETALSTYKFDYVLENNGTYDEFCDEIDKFCRDVYGI